MSSPPDQIFNPEVIPNPVTGQVNFTAPPTPPHTGALSSYDVEPLIQKDVG